MMTLDSMIMTIPDTAQVRRVKEIKQLVGEKKGYLLAIHQDLEQLRDVSGLMQQKIRFAIFSPIRCHVIL